MMRFLSSTLVFVSLVCLVASGGFAQEPAQAPDTAAAGDTSSAGTSEDPAEERATQFVGVEGADAERIPGGTLLLIAYGIVWLFLFLYLRRLRGLQRQTANEIARLTAKLQSPSE